MRSYSDACSCEEEGGGEAGREEDDESRARQKAGREKGCEEEVISSERSWGRPGRVAPFFERGARVAPFDSCVLAPVSPDIYGQIFPPQFLLTAAIAPQLFPADANFFVTAATNTHMARTILNPPAGAALTAERRGFPRKTRNASWRR